MKKILIMNFIKAFILIFTTRRCCCFTPITPLEFPRSILERSDVFQNLAIRPIREDRYRLKMLSYENVMEKIPSKEIIDAIEGSSSDGVIAPDVAASAGISISQARKDLTTLALLTQGDIAVSDDGELIYSFPGNINSVLSSNSIKFRALGAFRKAKPVLFYFLRISFGIALVSSILAIFSAIFILNQSSDEEDDDRGFRGGGDARGFPSSMNYWWGPSPFDFFYYRPYYGYYGSLTEDRVDPEEMGFLESTFSYIFGDGNPNQNLEQKRLILAADMIRENNGAVTAEQLAPFCDDAPDPLVDDSSYVDERFVLPIVTQLDGQPRVTEEGSIVYLFPELQTSASFVSSVSKENDRSILYRAKEEGEDTGFLEEKEYKFSLAPDGNRLLAGGLGVVNVLGAFYLGGQLSSYAAYGMKLPGFLGAVQIFYPYLASYAVLFNLIPFIRSFWIKRQNSLIQKRNQRRRRWKTVLSSAVGRLGKKLLSAQKLGTKMKRLSKEDVVYDTSKPLNELEKKKQMDDLDEFDRLLGD